MGAWGISEREARDRIALNDQLNADTISQFRSVRVSKLVSTAPHQGSGKQEEKGEEERERD